MKIISTKIHGVLDYLWGIFLIISPWLFHFETGDAAMFVPIILGGVMIVANLLTDYELGMLRVFKLRAHLLLDMLSALFLAVSPWLFGFYETVYLPHLILGLVQLVLALITETQPHDANGY